jgi:hypothetical protein
VSLLYRKRGRKDSPADSFGRKGATKFLVQEWGVEAGLLFCLPELAAYYVALGWQEVKSPVLIEQPGGKIVSPLCVMVLPVRKQGWSFGSTELRSLPW